MQLLIIWISKAEVLFGTLLKYDMNQEYLILDIIVDKTYFFKKIQNGHFDIVKVLIENGANADPPKEMVFIFFSSFFKKILIEDFTFLFID